MLTATNPDIASLFNQPLYRLLSWPSDENHGMPPLRNLIAPQDAHRRSGFPTATSIYSKLPLEKGSYDEIDHETEDVYGGFDYVEISHGNIELMQGRALFQIEFTSVKAIQVRVSDADAEGSPRWALVSPLIEKYMPNFEDAGQALDSVIEKLKEYFSPENVAQRIFDFATAYYGKGSFAGEDTPQLRERYRNFIMPAIERGFAEALAILGEMPDEVMEGINTTHDLIVMRFDDFVQGNRREDV